MTDDFLRRWSRRKVAGRQAPAAPAAPAVPEAQAPADPPAEAAEGTRTDAQILAEHGLPDPDTLTAGDDFRAFLVDTIPAHLKTRALRRLWTSNPVLANLDGLNDYDTDFTGTGLAPGEVLRTLHQVGRGFLQPDDPRPVPVAAGPQAQDDPEPDDSDQEPVPAQRDVAETPDAVAETPLPRPRRMRFRT